MLDGEEVRQAIAAVDGLRSYSVEYRGGVDEGDGDTAETGEMLLLRLLRLLLQLQRAQERIR